MEIATANFELDDCGISFQGFYDISHILISEGIVSQIKFHSIEILVPNDSSQDFGTGFLQVRLRADVEITILEHPHNMVCESFLQVQGATDLEIFTFGQEEYFYQPFQ